jgi:methyl-accepting chemotaxis protein
MKAGSGTRRRLRYRYRLAAAMLVVSLPLMVLLAVLLTSRASSSLTAAGERKGVGVARAVTLRLEDWISERRESLTILADDLAGRSPTDTAAALTRLDKTYGDFTLVELVDARGTLRGTSRPGQHIDPAGQAWFATALTGKSVLTSPVRSADHIQWILAQPVAGTAAHPAAVLIADLDPTVLAGVLNPELDPGSDVLAIDSQHRLIFDTESMSKASTDTALLAAGALTTTVTNTATQRATRTGEPGSARYHDPDGHDVIGGYDLVEDLHWVILAHDHANTVLAPVTTQDHDAIIIVTLSALLAITAATGFAWRTTRPLRRLTEASRAARDGDLGARVDPEGSSELVALGETFNAMLDTCQRLLGQTARAGVEVNSAAAELSASSDELAATTTQQSAAVMQATATTEELARASAAIADTVDEVARQAAETSDNLQQAEADITLSSERTLALADRVNDIDALRVLINDIADQTNLLALNAAIEAARAGEHGVGFAVVADEVRRLAERSKTSAGDIAAIVTAVQGETNATVMAMEKGAKQMQQGLTLLQLVTDAAGQVRLTTQQQRSANAQVVETMEQLTDASRQVSATAQQIAAAAGNLSDLAGNLETTATATKDRY